MKQRLANITHFQSGIYEKPDINADTLYLQAVHFTRYGAFDENVLPQLQSNTKLERHILKEGDLLFAAKGMNNFAVVYQTGIGKAVASSSFIVIRIKTNNLELIQPDYLAWFITHHNQIKLMHQQQKGTTIPSISMKQLAELEIDIPPIEVQKNIVAVHQLREKEKELSTQIEEYKDRQIKILLSNATKK